MSVKERVPYVKGIDNTLKLMQEGYEFIRNNAKDCGSDLFETHLMGEKVVCMEGPEAAKIFYDTEKFQRNGATPKRVQRTLTGIDALHTMDGEAHRHRKLFVMSLMTSEYQNRLRDIVIKKWEYAVSQWEKAEEVVLFDAAKDILCEAACEWAGVPLSKAELKDRADQFAAMVDAFGAAGPRHWRGRIARENIEDWIRRLIEDVRNFSFQAGESSPLYQMAFYRDQDGHPLDAQMAAIELINIIRPIIAVSIFITFAGLALYEHPEYKRKLADEGDKAFEMFAQEVRRHYPLAPFLGARVKKDFVWNQYPFKEGMLVLLDIYGTNHHPKLWDEPDRFKPERFEKGERSLFDFIPQGGGDPAAGHRCPGEGITIEMIKVSLDYLINHITFDVPRDQDFSYSLTKMPTLPRDGFVISHVRRKSESI